MKTNIPDPIEIEQLYNSKGKEAVIWYSWRTVSRTLPLLGYSPFEEIWKEQACKHIYNICRMYIVFANTPKYVNYNSDSHIQDDVFDYIGKSLKQVSITISSTSSTSIAESAYLASSDVSYVAYLAGAFANARSNDTIETVQVFNTI